MWTLEPPFQKISKQVKCLYSPASIQFVYTLYVTTGGGGVDGENMPSQGASMDHSFKEISKPNMKPHSSNLRTFFTELIIDYYLQTFDFELLVPIYVPYIYIHTYNCYYLLATFYCLQIITSGLFSTFFLSLTWKLKHGSFFYVPKSICYFLRHSIWV